MKKTCQKFALLALFAALFAPGLTACKSSTEPENKATPPAQPAQTNKPAMSEHPK